ncbi:glutathione synthase/RimK-type ligase-like ATP-grasp enzyme [Janthinobacterium sp. CG_23.3]|uniref:ATP-grasp domain-containing protein n=1 Tax=unclassified Janthinobacterium TaxID=2610881 RepID=UPI000364DE58|nr:MULTISPECIES: hypothetical protein [unclassified Janthinobacterium]MEC5162767.1 glutathione synthase/RimK-type ligase-like ATP-grasp enzyme [Janthinobacterium sp. CG_S6]
MTILIISEADDLHAAAVGWGLRALGCEPVLWRWSAFPRADSASFYLDSGGDARLELTLDGAVHSRPFDAVWNRRPGKPAPRAASHPADLKVIRDESLAYLRNVAPFIAHPGTLWVNGIDEARHANHKTLQLLAARAVGLPIPDTLIGNEIDKVRQFYRKHGGKIIYKAFQPGGWDHGDGSTTMLRTAALAAQDLAHEEAVRACPGIFQQQVDTDYELRVTVMGERLVAGAIHSQAAGPSVDWRYSGVLGQVPLTPVELAPELAARCLALCRRLGLAFGCIDLIVRPDGEAVFLEINEAGQFLWKEGIAPDLPMLDTFCRLLAGGGVGRQVPPLRLADYYQSASFAEFKLLERRGTAPEESLFTPDPPRPGA